MFLKLSTIILSIYLAFQIFPKGSIAINCSDAELQNCHRDSHSFEEHAFHGIKHYICSGTSEEMKCIESVSDYCKTKPSVPIVMISKILTTTHLLKRQRIKWECDKSNGGGGQKTSLIAIAVTCLSALKTFY